MRRSVRRASPREIPAVIGFQQYARFEHVNLADHCSRFYLLSLQPTLLGDIAVVRTWGRIGTNGTSLAATFPDRRSAQPTVERLIRRRMQRRYELTAWT